MENHIRPEVDSRRGDQSILHVALTCDKPDESVQKEDFCKKNGA